MIVLSIILLVLGFLVTTSALGSVTDLWARLGELFTNPGYAFSKFFDPQWFPGYKTWFLVGLAVLIAGVAVLVVALIKKAKNGEAGKLDSKAAKYVRDLNGERKKVIWPTMKTVAKNTAVVLVICALVAVVVCGIDIGLNALIKLMA